MNRLKIFAVMAFFGALFTASQLIGEEHLQDGMLGLTMEAIHGKLGMPKDYYLEEIPYRRYWLYPVEEASQVEPKFWADPNVPRDEMFPVERAGKKLLYRLQYAWDKSQPQAVQKVKKYWVYLKENPVELKDLASVVSEFASGVKADVLCFKSHQLHTNRIVVTFLLPETSELAGIIANNFREPADTNQWGVSYEVILCDGEEEVSLKSKVYEVIIVPSNKRRLLGFKKLGYNEIVNPFSS
ncbi:MAG: hypothetical protein A3E19_01010 [Planctomycetes bacterium RIFCSPHIGHO2_12_FULL_52_36]|nr:MAG: hypothetical protein A3E19_01010 [Planctomycetes bacterium RIFCSPHIGHO2_12_FULL_52_36]